MASVRVKPNVVKSPYMVLRLMSSYPKHFIDPIFCKNEQRVINATEQKKIMHMPTKAAKNNESNSIFYNGIVQKMINYITKGGNKQLARNLLENSFDCIKRTQIERINLGKENNCVVDPCRLLVQAIENSRPLMQLTSIKRGGVKYQVPVPVTEKRSYFLAMQWILDAAREKERNVHFPEKLAWEILDAAYGQGRVGTLRPGDISVKQLHSFSYYKSDQLFRLHLQIQRLRSANSTLNLLL